MGIIKKVKCWLGADEFDEESTIRKENSQLRKKLKRNNKDIIEIMNERDEIKDELLEVYRQRATDFDKVLMFRDEYAKYYNIHKDQKKEISDLKQEIRKKDEEINNKDIEIKEKDKQIKELSNLSSSSVKRPTRTAKSSSKKKTTKGGK